MKIVELFAGTKSIGKEAWARGHQIVTVDNNPDFVCDITGDILSINPRNIILSGCGFQDVDMLWASPPCTTFSVASLGHHWTGGRNAYIPKTEACKLGLKLLDRTVYLICYFKPKIWFIENPRGVMRKLINGIFDNYHLKGITRHTLTYCQYGDTRMKPTDIWTNCKTWNPKPMCKNGSPCHESAPRGSRTGTQGLKNNTLRSIMPPELCREIIIATEKGITVKELDKGQGSLFNG